MDSLLLNLKEEKSIESLPRMPIPCFMSWHDLEKANRGLENIL